MRRAVGEAFMVYIYLLVFVALALSASGILILAAHLLGIEAEAAR